MKHSAALQTFLAICASIASGLRSEQFASESTISTPARARFGKSAGGSGMLRKRRHPVFGRKRIRYAQPEGYYPQKIDSRHLRSYGTSSTTAQNHQLQRPSFA
jgi:hypothetical protein